MVDFLNPLISAAAGLGGVFLGGWLSDRREREKRRTAFVTRQLSEFYGPLVSMRTEIRSRGELRVKIENAMKKSKKTVFSATTENELAEFMAKTQDEYKIFTDVSMVLYRKMIEVFRKRMWLAEPETREYLPQLIEFVDVWERRMRDAMPDEVVLAIEHSEENLRSFYDHLATTHDRLRSLL